VIGTGGPSSTPVFRAWNSHYREYLRFYADAL